MLDARDAAFILDAFRAAQQRARNDEAVARTETPQPQELGAIGSERGSRASDVASEDEAGQPDLTKLLRHADTAAALSDNSFRRSSEDASASMSPETRATTPPAHPAPLAANERPRHGNGRTNIYIAWLPRTFEQEDLTQLVAPYGTVASTRLVQSGCRTYAFVMYETRADAERAIEGLNATRFNGRRLQARISAAHDGARIAPGTATTVQRPAPQPLQQPQTVTMPLAGGQSTQATPMILAMDAATGSYHWVAATSMIPVMQTVYTMQPRPSMSVQRTPLAPPPPYQSLQTAAAP